MVGPTCIYCTFPVINLLKHVEVTSLFLLFLLLAMWFVSVKIIPASFTNKVTPKF